MLFLSGISFAQTDRLWSPGALKSTSGILENKTGIINPRIYSLDINGLKNALAQAPKRLAAGEKSEVIVSFPNAEGKMENFKIRENSNFDPQISLYLPRTMHGLTHGERGRRGVEVRRARSGSRLLGATRRVVRGVGNTSSSELPRGFAYTPCDLTRLADVCRRYRT